MKKNSLTTAVVASLAGIAGIANISNAVNLNPDGLGQVLIYPYFTVEKGNQTLISVVNTTNIGKAVKVRFLEGVNSREILDFNLYLSPFDVWTAAIYDTKNGPGIANSNTGPATLITRDNSCTVPTIIGRPGSNVDFRSGQYTGTNNDSGSDAIERTREGYLEIIEMGSIPRNKFQNDEREPGFGAFIVPSVPNGTFRASLHASGGSPAGCADIVNAWSLRDNGDFFGGVTARDYRGSFGDFVIDQNDFAPPTGGLFGGGAVVDTANGSYINYAAEAIDGFRSQSIHTAPENLSPSLNSATGINRESNPRSFVFNNGALVISEWRLSGDTGATGSAIAGQPTSGSTGSSIDSVSAVLQSEVISNEFATESSLNGSSEWVVTFPTKRFYVDDLYAAVFPDATTAIPPFTNRFNRRNAAGIVEAGAARSFACETLLFGFRNREEAGPTSGSPPDFSPPLGGGVPASSLCFESQVVSFNQAGGTSPSKIFGSRLNANLATFNSGWSTFDFSRTGTSTTSQNRFLRRSQPLPVGLNSGSHVWRGLPAIGFWATTLENNAAQPGRLANYGGAFTHKRTRNCGIVTLNTLGATVVSSCNQF